MTRSGSPGSQPAANPATVVLRWLAVRPDDPAAVGWRAMLDDAERARADRFRFAADRLAYTAAHALLRRMLADADGLAPGRWRFVTAAGGKPAVEPALRRPTLQFSLSHTRGMVACAVGRTRSLGVDVERCGYAASVLEVAGQYLAPAEAALLAGLEPDARRAAFGRLWVLKEAYVKATGRGLAEPLDAFAFTLAPVAISFRPPLQDDPAACRFTERRLDARYALALAVRDLAAGPLVLDAGTPLDRRLD